MRFHLENREILSHRFAWWLVHDKQLPPKGFLLCHILTCQFKNCCTPSHLYVGTIQSNNSDRKELGGYKVSGYYLQSKL